MSRTCNHMRARQLDDGRARGGHQTMSGMRWWWSRVGWVVAAGVGWAAAGCVQ